MKKKLIIIGASAGTLLIALIIVLIIVLNQPSFNKLAIQMSYSMDKVEKIDSVTTFTDDKLLIKKYEKNLEIDGKKATINTSTSEYNSKFEFETTTSTEVVDINKDNLLMIVMKEELFDIVELTKEKILASASKENIKKIFNNDELEILGIGEFEFLFEDKLIKQIRCFYQTPSGYCVYIVISYQY